MGSFKRTAGFTLIELVIVIAILGVLAATALPKFTNLLSGTGGARAAAVQGQARTFMAAVQTVQAAWQAQGAPSTSFTYNGNTVTIGTTTVGTTYGAYSTGWPSPEASNAGATVSALWGLVMQGSSTGTLPSGWATRSGAAITTAATTAAYPANNTTAPASGQITYYLSSVSTICGFVYSELDGSVVTATTNC